MLIAKLIPTSFSLVQKAAWRKLVTHVASELSRVGQAHSSCVVATNLHFARVASESCAAPTGAHANAHGVGPRDAFGPVAQKLL